MTSQVALRFISAAILVAFTVVNSAAVQTVSEPELLLREALHKQQVEGDLPGAIKIYQQIVSARNGNRAITAKVLLELAGCYEKLGRQAETVYQQIVRDYSDQPAAAQARAKLAALRPAAPTPTMTLRKIELGNDLRNIVATDGDRAVYWDLTGTILYFGDVAGKQKRTILESKRGPRAYVSRDLSTVLLFFPLSAQGPEKFAVVKTDGTGYRDLTLNDKGTPLKVDGLGPLCGSWSWDNRYFLICKPEPSGTRLLRIALVDGQIQDLLPGKPAANPVVNRAEFSPDGRFVAFGQQGFAGPVYVVPVQGGETHLISADAFLADWTRDGRYVIVGQPSSNAVTMVAVPVLGGRPAGDLISLRAVQGTQARTMSNGALLVSTSTTTPVNRIVSVGTLAIDNRSIKWTELELIGNAGPTGWPTWSPSADKFAYVSAEPSRSTRTVRIRDVASGEDRELYRGERIIGCVWAHQRPLLFCGQPLEGTKTEIFSVSIDSGHTEKVGVLNTPVVLNHLSRDDRKLLLTRGQSNDFSEWEIGTDREVIFRNSPSEDARWTMKRLDTGGIGILQAGGTDSEWKFLVARRIPPPTAGPIPVRFSPDGNWLLYHDRDPDGGNGLYRIPTEVTGEPERLGDYPTTALTSLLSISADGRKFIVNAPGSRQPDFWALENFLPAAPALKAAPKTGGK